MARTADISVSFHFADVSVGLTKRNKLKQFLVCMFRAENRKLASLKYIFCKDQRLLLMNRMYLGHDFYTDILTFDLSTAGTGIAGEVYISVDRIRENAATYGVSLTQELHRVIFHGALHLCGYNDDSISQKKLMTKKEDLYLAKYKVFHVKQFD